MELQQIKTDANVPYRYMDHGDFIKIETVPSGNELFIKTSEGETFKGPAGRSIKFEKAFDWYEISGQVPGESIELQTGLGWMMDSVFPPVTVIVPPEAMPIEVANPAFNFATSVPASGALQTINFPTAPNGDKLSSPWTLLDINNSPGRPTWTGGTAYIQVTGRFPNSVQPDPVAIFNQDGTLFAGNGRINANGSYYVKTLGRTILELQMINPNAEDAFAAGMVTQGGF